MIYNLRVLRAVAAHMVVLHHASASLRPLLRDRPPIEIGAAGVDTFFVISGVIVVATTAGRDVRPADFLLRRVARLFPVYAFVTLLVASIALAGFRPVGVLVRKSTQTPCPDFLSHLNGPARDRGGLKRRHARPAPAIPAAL